MCSTCVYAADYAKYKSVKEQGILLYSQNEIQKAYKTFASIPEKDRESDIYVLMANILQDMNKPMEAVYHLKKAILADYSNYKAYYNLGNLYLEDNKLNLAISNYKTSIKYNSKFPYSYYNLGLCEYKLNNYKKAKKYFVQAILRKQDEPDFYYNLSLTYSKLNNEKKAKEAMEAYYKLANNDITY